MRVAMLGGSFNPVHYGHIEIARAVQREFSPDVIYFTVAADPPHKEVAYGVTAASRYEMVRLALEDYPGMEASDMELVRGGKSYTADTVEQLANEYPGAELLLIVGKDMLSALPNWHEPERIISRAVIVGVDRPDVEADLQRSAAALREGFGARVLLTSVGGPDISSTAIRAAVYDALPISALTPVKVWDYIYESGLYTQQDIAAMLPKLRSTVSKKRYTHTMGVVEEALTLAQRFGGDLKKARLAALLHDCGKADYDKQLELAKKYGVSEGDVPALLHSRLGAVMARKEYGVEDEEILLAIEHHTAGRADMTLLEKILFVADKTERLTRTDELMQPARELAKTDLDGAVLMLMDMSIKYVKRRGLALAEETLSARDYIQKLIKD